MKKSSYFILVSVFLFLLGANSLNAQTIIQTWNFETALENWTAGGDGSSIGLSTDHPYNGSSSVKLIKPPTGLEINLQNDVYENLQEGDVLTYHVWISAADLALVNGCQIFWQTTDSWNWNSQWTNGSSLTGDAWTTVQHTLPAVALPLQRIGFQLLLQTGNEAATPTLYVDYITITRVIGGPVAFTNITGTSGISTSGGDYGFSWGDYNADGDLDLFVDGGTGGVSALYSNNSNGTFTSVTSPDPSANATYGSLWADFNGDGNLDILFGDGGSAIKLYLGDGAGVFTDGTAAAGLDTLLTGSANPGGNPSNSAAADYDQDGDLDIVFAGNLGTASPVRLLQNNNGIFSNVASTALSVVDTAEAWNPAWVDYNNDGWMDLFVPSFRNGFPSNRSLLYLNDGDGTFTEATSQIGDVSAIASAWGDFNNDGYIDLLTQSGVDPAAIKLFKNNGNSTFTDIAGSAGLVANGSIRGLSWGDYDNDGYQDIIVGVNGNAMLYRNNGNETFADSSTVIGTLAGMRCALFVDYNNDGFLDAFLSYNGARALLQNGGNSNSWIAFNNLTGAANNKAGIGTRFTVYTNGGTIKQVRDVQAGGCGGMTGGNIVAHFGLGSATIVDSVVISWSNGIVDRYSNVAINQYYSPTIGVSIPVELTSFTASVNESRHVSLQWTTASELNNRGFEIERKTTAGEFYTIGFIKGYGTSSEEQNYSYLDKSVQSGVFIYRLKQMDFNGQFEYSNEVQVEVVIYEFNLSQNYPNPFNPITTISFSIPVKSNVNLILVDILGNIVKEIVSGELEAGNHQIKLDGSDLASSVYFYRLTAGDFVSIKKLILMK